MVREGLQPGLPPRYLRHGLPLGIRARSKEVPLAGHRTLFHRRRGRRPSRIQQSGTHLPGQEQSGAQRPWSRGFLPEREPEGIPALPVQPRVDVREGPRRQPRLRDRCYLIQKSCETGQSQRQEIPCRNVLPGSRDPPVGDRRPAPVSGSRQVGRSRSGRIPEGRGFRRSFL